LPSRNLNSLSNIHCIFCKRDSSFDFSIVRTSSKFSLLPC
jgi:hypothetical protein